MAGQSIRSGSRKKLLPYGHQWIDSTDIRPVVEVLKSDFITQGPRIEEFEKAVADYCGVEYGVAMSSGTAALHAACVVAGLHGGDEAIVPTMTFMATANAVVYAGARPVLADIDGSTLCLDPRDAAQRVTPNTKAILPVDFGGHPHHADEISDLARSRKLIVIEDASHALGAEYKGRKVGGLADISILSFHPVKHITTGEGGMLLTNERSIFRKAKLFRHHNIIPPRRPQVQGLWFYDLVELGHNFRITDIQCALGLSQLKKLPRFVRRRRELASRYGKRLWHAARIRPPTEAPWAWSSYHLYVVRIDFDGLGTNRLELFNQLRSRNIGVQVHYVPVHYLTYYRKRYGYRRGMFPVSERYYSQALTLPLFPSMENEDVDDVSNSLEQLVR